MQQTITIAVPGEELESISIELTQEEVRSVYLARKELHAKVADLEKKVAALETSKKYADDNLAECRAEMAQANAILSALGIKEKTENEDSWARKDLSLPTRIALYIATFTNGGK